MFITDEDRIIPSFTLQTSVPKQVKHVSTFTRWRRKFVHYNWVAFAVYVGLFAHLG